MCSPCLHRVIGDIVSSLARCFFDAIVARSKAASIRLHSNVARSEGKFARVHTIRSRYRLGAYACRNQGIYLSIAGQSLAARARRHEACRSLHFNRWRLAAAFDQLALVILDMLMHGIVEGHGGLLPVVPILADVLGVAIGILADGGGGAR